MPDLAQACTVEHMAGGVAVGDVDGDGWPDLYLSGLAAPDTLLVNQRDGTFVDETWVRGLGTLTGGNGAAWLDIEGDGDLDLFVSTIGNTPYRLFVNRDGHFVDEAAERGVAVADPRPRAGFSIAVGDYDRDGAVDIFVTEWLRGGDRDGSHARLLHNLGDGRFEDVTESSGVRLRPPHSGPGRFGFSAAFADLDGDGWQDLALVSDFGTSTLYWNQGNGRFQDGTRGAAVGLEQAGMGSTIADIDGDGDLDWFVSSLYVPDSPHEVGNVLYFNLGARRFADATDTYAVRDGGWGWGAAFVDIDNDGRLDLVQTNGMEQRGQDYSAFDRPIRLWLQADDGTMRDVAARAGLGEPRSGRGLALLDYDRDGDVDLVIARNDDAPILYRNDSSESGWLRLHVDEIGARVEADGRIAEVGSVTHFLGQSEPIVHFGLGVADCAEVSVGWPGGSVERFGCLSGRHYLRRGEGQPAKTPACRFSADQRTRTPMLLLLLLGWVAGRGRRSRGGTR